MQDRVSLWAALFCEKIRKWKLTLKVNNFEGIFQYISNKMQPYTVYLYLETALHVSGGTSTHHQERIQLYLQYLLLLCHQGPEHMPWMHRSL